MLLSRGSLLARPVRASGPVKSYSRLIKDKQQTARLLVSISIQSELLVVIDFSPPPLVEKFFLANWIFLHFLCLA